MAEVHTLDVVFKPVTCMRTVAGCHGLLHALDGGWRGPWCRCSHICTGYLDGGG